MTEKIFSNLLGHSLQQPLYPFILETLMQPVPVCRHKYVWGVICWFKIALCSPHSCPCVVLETQRFAESEWEQNMFLTNELQFISVFGLLRTCIFNKTSYNETRDTKYKLGVGKLWCRKFPAQFILPLYTYYIWWCDILVQTCPLEVRFHMDLMSHITNWN